MRERAGGNKYVLEGTFMDPQKEEDAIAAKERVLLPPSSRFSVQFFSFSISLPLSLRSSFIPLRRARVQESQWMMEGLSAPSYKLTLTTSEGTFFHTRLKGRLAMHANNTYGMIPPTSQSRVRGPRSHTHNVLLPSFMISLFLRTRKTTLAGK